jgi:hypothetical protein
VAAETSANVAATRFSISSTVSSLISEIIVIEVSEQDYQNS